MHGCIIACTIHAQVYNAQCQQWQDVPQSTLDELLEMAQELGNVDVHEGCCPECSAIAANSFKVLYQMRYLQAARKEYAEIKFPWDEEYWE